jgi:hypothetical protein
VSAGTDLQILKQESQQLKEAIQVQEDLRNAYQRRFDKTAAILQVIQGNYFCPKATPILTINDLLRKREMTLCA